MTDARSPFPEAAARPEPTGRSVQFRVGDRWIVGQSVRVRSDEAGSQHLIRHHGHLEWIPAGQIRGVVPEPVRTDPTPAEPMRSEPVHMGHSPRRHRLARSAS